MNVLIITDGEPESFQGMLLNLQAFYGKHKRQSRIQTKRERRDPLIVTLKVYPEDQLCLSDGLGKLKMIVIDAESATNCLNILKEIEGYRGDVTFVCDDEFDADFYKEIARRIALQAFTLIPRQKSQGSKKINGIRSVIEAAVLHELYVSVRESKIGIDAGRLLWKRFG